MVPTADHGARTRTTVPGPGPAEEQGPSADRPSRGRPRPTPGDVLEPGREPPEPRPTLRTLASTAGGNLDPRTDRILHQEPVEGDHPLGGAGSLPGPAEPDAPRPRHPVPE